ncbi:MAG: hypothetical protein HYY25_14725 [Candidatus Wallbacteria bacterium]|nr:hypothetical protein [Candidatus Wallbacteria bacterium]
MRLAGYFWPGPIPGLCAVLALASTAWAGTSSREIARELVFGQQGTEQGEFKQPAALALTAERDLYVADAKKDTVERFSQFGKFLKPLTPSQGTFEGPIGVTVDARGNVFVAETRGNRVRKFDPAGKELAVFGRTGSAPGLFGSPRGIAVGSSGHIFVADYYNSRIQELDNDGRFVRAFTFRMPDQPAPVQPRGVGVDYRDRLYGVYGGINRIVRFNADGDAEFIFGTYGRLPGYLNDPRYITFDIRDNIYVSDLRNHRVQKFDEQGMFLGSFGGRGSAQGQFNEPQGIAVDPEGNLYVADGENCRVQILVVNEYRRNLNLGLWNFRQQDFARAAFHYEEVMRNDPQNKEAMESLVTSYRTLSERAFSTGDTSGAKKYLGGILRLRPGNSDARAKLRSLVWEENRSDLYYPTVGLGIVLALVFVASLFFRFLKA